MSQHELPFQKRIVYAHRALTKLAALWNSRNSNYNGLRSIFRRWRPGRDGEPTMDMRSSVWGYVPFDNGGEPAEEATEQRFEISREQAETIDRAATLVALRAMAGDHPGAPVPLGTALQKAGLTDLRLMRLLTTSRSMRVEALIRAFQRINHERIMINWTMKETERIYNFLFGSAEAARWSINAWAGEFFRTRGTIPTDAGSTTTADIEHTSTLEN